LNNNQIFQKSKQIPGNQGTSCFVIKSNNTSNWR